MSALRNVRERNHLHVYTRKVMLVVVMLKVVMNPLGSSTPLDLDLLHQYHLWILIPMMRICRLGR